MGKILDFCSLFHQKNKRSYGRHLSDDCISSLPGEVLLIILSLLPLKETVKTSMVSKQWRNLWVNTPVLDFDLDLAGFNDMMLDYFVKWVNHVLQRHKGLYLKKYRVCCNLLRDYQEDIDRWLEFALARKVEILELDFLLSGRCNFQGLNYVLNDYWFSNGNANLDASRSRALQCNLKFLRSLSLKNVTFTDEAVNYILRNCSLLERLELCGSRSLVNLVISDPKLVLKHLRIKYCQKLEILSISNFNLVSLDTMVGNLILKDLSMLVELSLVGYANNLRRILSQNATCLGRLESLKLYVYRMKEVTELLSNLAQMTKLKRLVIEYMANDDVPLTQLLSVIKSCNHLEEFVLELRWTTPKRQDRNMLMVEGHSSPKLKLFEFKGYYGRVSDVELMMHVVMNAPLLERIIIDPCNIRLRSLNCPVNDVEQEARRFALKQVEDLKEAKYILPHVDVLIR